MQIPICTSKQMFASVIAATSAIADRNCWSLECQCPIGQRDCIRKLSSSNRKRGLLANAMIRPGKLERLMIRLMITTLLFLALPSSLFFPRCIEREPFKASLHRCLQTICILHRQWSLGHLAYLRPIVICPHHLEQISSKSGIQQVLLRVIKVIVSLPR